jgi:Pyruvate/2-oxoacid:ferredoxin oxidoreductase delta subunit
MAFRQIVKIDEEKCDGCGVCVPACSEGALQIVDGKAKLVAEVYCDGLGACLGDCPNDAISVEERDADEFDEAAVEKHLQTMEEKTKAGVEPPPLKPLQAVPMRGSCPGAAMRQMKRPASRGAGPVMDQQESALGHWPVQLMLVPAEALFLQHADLLICADCVPFVVPDFHSRFLAGKSVLVACPKLDDLDHYRRKMKEIVATAKPKSLTVLRMEVPCCGGLAQMVLDARDQFASHLDVKIYTLGVQGGEKIVVSSGERSATLL